MPNGGVGLTAGQCRPSSCHVREIMPSLRAGQVVGDRLGQSCSGDARDVDGAVVNTTARLLTRWSVSAAFALARHELPRAPRRRVVDTGAIVSTSLVRAGPRVGWR